MKKIWKYIVGFFTFILGILVLSGKKNKKVKNLDKQIKDVNKELKSKQKQNKAYKKTLESKKEALEKIKKETYKKKDIGAKEASDFLKDFSKGGK